MVSEGLFCLLRQLVLFFKRGISLFVISLAQAAISIQKHPGIFYVIDMGQKKLWSSVVYRESTISSGFVLPLLLYYGTVLIIYSCLCR
mmetsp:Transcript_56366/g.65062  ORF Transcript_56366/g.65062 Transcript_56366/m.65062 type:complete len:88 (+) Transcript_56366:71-334(+)